MPKVPRFPSVRDLGEAPGVQGAGPPLGHSHSIVAGGTGGPQHTGVRGAERAGWVSWWGGPAGGIGSQWEESSRKRKLRGCVLCVFCALLPLHTGSHERLSDLGEGPGLCGEAARALCVRSGPAGILRFGQNHPFPLRVSCKEHRLRPPARPQSRPQGRESGRRTPAADTW